MLAVLVETTRLVLAIINIIIGVVVNICIVPRQSGGPLCNKLTNKSKKKNLEAKTLVQGNLEGGGGRLQRQQEGRMHLQLGGTSEVRFLDHLCILGDRAAAQMNIWLD